MAFGDIGTAYVEIDASLAKLQASLSKSVADSTQAGGMAGAAFAKGFDISTKEGFDAFGRHLDQTLAEAKTHLEQLQITKAFRQDLDSLGADLTGIGTRLSLGLTAPLVAFGAAALESFSSIDALKRGLTAVAGSASEAEKEFTVLREVAKLPGLGLEEAVKGSINLQTIGMSAADAATTLTAFGNAIATVGGGKSEMGQLVVQLRQLGASFEVTQQDLRPIINLVPQVAKIIKESFGPEALGHPAETFKALGMSGADLVAVLTRELGKLPAVTGGLKNDLENFSDTVKISLADVGKSMEPISQAILQRVSPAIEDLTRRFVALSPEAKNASIALAGIAAAAGPSLIFFGQAAKGGSDLIGVLQKINAEAPGIAGNIGAVGAAVAAIHFAGIDTAFLDLWRAVDQAWRERADDLAELGRSIRTVAEVTGLGPIADALRDLGTVLHSISGLDLGNLLSLENFAKTALGPLGLIAEPIKQIAAGIEVWSGKAKTMDDALFHLADAQKKAIETVEAHRIAYEKAGTAVTSHTTSLKANTAEHVSGTPKVQSHTTAIREQADALKTLKSISDQIAGPSATKSEADGLRETTNEILGQISAHDDLAKRLKQFGDLTQNMVRVNGELVPTLMGTGNAVEKLAGDIGGGLTAAMENGVRVIRGSVIPANEELASSAVSVGNAYADLPRIFTDAAHGMETLAQVQERLAKSQGAMGPSQMSMGSRNANEQSISGQTADALSLIGFAASQFFNATGMIMTSFGTGPGLIGGALKHSPSQEELRNALTGDFSAEFSGQGKFDPNRFDWATRTWKDAKASVDDLNGSISKLELSAKNAAAAADKAGPSMEVENEQRRLATDASNELARQMGDVYDQMRRLEDAGQGSSEEFFQLQQQLITLNARAHPAADSLRRIGDSLNPLASAGGMAADSVLKAAGSIAVLASVSAIAAEASRGAAIANLPQAALPSLPTGPNTQGGAVVGQLIGGRVVSPQGIVININGGNYSSTNFVNEIQQQLTDALRRDVGLRL